MCHSPAGRDRSVDANPGSVARADSGARAQRRLSRPRGQAGQGSAGYPLVRLGAQAGRQELDVAERAAGPLPRRPQGADRNRAGLLSRRLEGRARRDSRRCSHVRAHDVQGVAARSARGARAPSEGGGRAGQRLHHRGSDRLSRHGPTVVRRLRAAAGGRADAEPQAVSGDGRLRAPRGRGGEAPAGRQRSGRQGDREVPRARLHQAPLQLDRHRHDRRSGEGHAGRLPALLRHVLPAEQRDADPGRRSRRADGPQAGRPVLRADPARPRAAAQHGGRAAADGATHGHAADRGADPDRGRRLPHPARGRSRSAGAGGAGGHPFSRRVVAPAGAPGPPRSPGDRRGRRDGVAGGSGTVHRLRGLPAQQGRRGGAGSAGRGDRARARQAGRAGGARQGQEPAGRRIRVRPGDRRRHCHPPRRGAVRRGGLAPLHRRGDALPGGDRRRRAARGAEVLDRQQSHPGDAGAARGAADGGAAARRGAEDRGGK